MCAALTMFFKCFKKKKKNLGDYYPACPRVALHSVATWWQYRHLIQPTTSAPVNIHAD